MDPLDQTEGVPAPSVPSAEEFNQLLNKVNELTEGLNRSASENENLRRQISVFDQMLNSQQTPPAQPRNDLPQYLETPDDVAKVAKAAIQDAIAPMMQQFQTGLRGIQELNVKTQRPDFDDMFKNTIELSQRDPDVNKAMQILANTPGIDVAKIGYYLGHGHPDYAKTMKEQAIEEARKGISNPGISTLATIPSNNPIPPSEMAEIEKINSMSPAEFRKLYLR